MSSSVSVLLSKVQLDRKQTELTSANIARADVDGYTKKYAYTEKVLGNNAVGGVKQSPISRVVDTVLQTQVRNQNSALGKSEILSSYYANISQMLGNKGDDSSFVHNLNLFAVSMTQLAGITDGNKKREAVQQAITLANQLNQISSQINNLRGQADQDLNTAIMELNGLITSMQDYDKQIVALSTTNTDSTNLQDERDLVIQNAAELCGIKIYNGDYNNQSLALETGDVVATSTNAFLLSYTAASYVAPGDILSPITSSTGLDLTDSFNSGQISALITLRDEILPNLQAEFDELTRVLRDTTNALHNEASALAGESTLTGLSYAPNVAGPLAGTTAISGQGTLRIGVTDSSGTILDYKDVPLTDGMTVASLVAAISSSLYVTSNPLGTFTVSQLATGELQITSDSNYSISLGASGTVAPSLSATATYDSTQAYGFSHFFGMNNLFDTGSSVASAASQVGIANNIIVRPSIANNSNNLSIGRLSSTIPAPTGAGLGLAASDSSVALQIGDSLARGNLNFLNAGVLNVASISADEYATRIMTVIQADIANSTQVQDITQRVYEELATLAQNKSGVDPSDEILRIFELSTSQNLSSKALGIVQAMNKDLIDTLSR